MSRLDHGPDKAELVALKALYDLASDIQDLLFYQQAQGIDPRTIAELKRAYRVLRRAIIYWHGEGNHVLVFDASTTFKKKGTNASIL